MSHFPLHNVENNHNSDVYVSGKNIFCGGFKENLNHIVIFLSQSRYIVSCQQFMSVNDFPTSYKEFKSLYCASQSVWIQPVRNYLNYWRIWVTTFINVEWITFTVKKYDKHICYT